MACKVPANDNVKDGLNATVINVFASSKVSKISDAHGTHSIVSCSVVKSENKARDALSENNLQKYIFDCRPIVVSNVKTSMKTRAPMNVPI